MKTVQCELLNLMTQEPNMSVRLSFAARLFTGLLHGSLLCG